MIALNNQINAAREATKTRTSDVETFQSGDIGFLGYADTDRVLFYRTSTRRQYIELKQNTLPYVEIIATYGGVDGTLIRAALNAGAKGIVVQALGWGHVNVPIYDAIKEAISKDIPVVISTRVHNGRVVSGYGFKGGGQTLRDAGAIFADNLSPQKARLVLMLALQTTSDSAEIQKLFDR
jgi:L-asparaginase